MDYRPVTAVWEITMGCNMRCKHCGSSCDLPLPDQLTTKEALELARDLADLGLEWITLSGGEPLIRKDWDLIASEFSSHGVIPNIITNGWKLTRKTLERAKAAGIGTIACSLDGLQESHDYMRKPGSFERVVQGLRLMKGMDVTCGVITTINRRNLPELTGLRELLADIGVRYWQLQIGLPMGNFAHNMDLIMEPAQVDEIIDFSYETMRDGRVTVYPADCVGYYNLKELEVRRKAHRTSDLPYWKGCNAGKRSLGILHNGDILGCTSIRDRQYVEGNVRERPIREIWNDENAFVWNRRARKSELDGVCRICRYGDVCLGGCPNTRLTMNGRMSSENLYCSYNQAVRRTRVKLEDFENLDDLKGRVGRYLAKGEFQLASLVLERLLRDLPEDKELLSLYGFVCYSLNNFEECRDINARILHRHPEDAYANKGMGIALHRLGHTDEGIGYLRRAVERATPDDMDPYHDLAVVYLESGRTEEARELLEKGGRLSAEFAKQHAIMLDESGSFVGGNEHTDRIASH